MIRIYDAAGFLVPFSHSKGGTGVEIETKDSEITAPESFPPLLAVQILYLAYQNHLLLSQSLNAVLMRCKT